MKNFRDLFIHELRDIYSAEVQMEGMFSEIIKGAHEDDLRELLCRHYEETKAQIERLQVIGEELGVHLTGRFCEVMRVFLLEARKIISSDYSTEVRDAALISCMQKIEHYEISAYGTLKSFARHLHMKSVEKLLHQTSKEEGRADKKLSDIAVGTLFSQGINEKAVEDESA